MQPRRGTNEVVRTILEQCQGGALKTRIANQSNLNSKRVKPYLASLIEGGLLEVVEGPQTIYRITEKGKETLRLLKEMVL